MAAYFLMGYTEDINQVERELLLRSERNNSSLIGKLNALLERTQYIQVMRVAYVLLHYVLKEFS